jgi:hypothetical protein
MRGKSAFTQREAETIRQKLREVRRGDRDLQRQLREKLRAMGFYVSDFSRSSHGFTAADLFRIVAALPSGSTGSMRRRAC